MHSSAGVGERESGKASRVLNHCKSALTCNLGRLGQKKHKFKGLDLYRVEIVPSRNRLCREIQVQKSKGMRRSLKS